MPGVEEVARLIVEAEAKGFADADAKIDDVNAKLQALTASYKAGGMPLDDYLSKGARLQGELDQLRDSYKVADEALKKHGTTQAATAALTQQFSAASRGAQERVRGVAFAMNDFLGSSGGFAQRLNSIGNNLPQMFAGLSPALMNFGLALGAAAPLVGILIQNWDTLGKKIEDVLGLSSNEGWANFKKAIVDAFEGSVKEAVDHLDALKAKVKELDEKPHKLEMDYIDLTHAKEEIDKITEGLRAIEELKKHQSKPEKESGEQVKTAIAESRAGATKVTADLEGQFQKAMMVDPKNALGVTRQQIEAKKKEIQEASAADLGIGGEGGDANSALITRLEADLAALEKKQNFQTNEITRKGGLAEQEAGKLIAGGEHGVGPAQAQDQAKLKAMLAAAGHQDVADQITNAQELEEYDKQAKDFENRMDAAKDAGERRRILVQHQKEGREKAEKARKIADDKAKEEAKVLLAHPEAALALHGQRALDAAEALLDKPEIRAPKPERPGPRGPLGARQAAPIDFEPQVAFAMPGMREDGVRDAWGGVRGERGINDPRLPQPAPRSEAPRPNVPRPKRPRTVDDRIRAGQARATAKADERAAVVKAAQEKKQDRKLKLGFQNALRPKLASTVIPGGKAADPKARQAIAAETARTAARKAAGAKAIAAAKAKDAARRFIGGIPGRVKAVVGPVQPPPLVGPVPPARAPRQENGNLNPGQAAPPDVMQRLKNMPEPKPEGQLGIGKLGQAQGDNQQKLMQLASVQNGSIGALLNRQQKQSQDIDSLLRDASRTRQQVSNSPSASNTGASQA